MRQNNELIINKIKDLKKNNFKKNTTLSKEIQNLSKEIEEFIKNNEKLNITNSLILSLDKNEKYTAKTFKNNQLNLNQKDLAAIISDNTHNKKRYIYLNDSNIAKSFNVGKVNYLKKNNIEIIHSENLKIKFKDNAKEISFKQSNNSDWVLIKGSKLDGWKINFEGTKQSNNAYQKNNQRINYHGMTGCLNFYDIEFENTIINSKFSNCEDSVNIVNSNGFIQKIKINDSVSDALDLDFSNIKIIEIKFTNVEFCHDTYKKKQEFNGSYLKFNYLKCNSNSRTDMSSITKIISNEF